MKSLLLGVLDEGLFLGKKIALVRLVVHVPLSDGDVYSLLQADELNRLLECGTRRAFPISKR